MVSTAVGWGWNSNLFEFASFSRMRYFFHLAHGRGFALDQEGDEFHDDETAIAHARSIGREMVEYRHYYWPTITRSAFLVTDVPAATLPRSPFPKDGKAHKRRS
jgi:hypothetical protein